jgi:hypothetical protein
MEYERISPRMVLHCALISRYVYDGQFLARMVDEERCVFTPGLYHNAGQQVTMRPGQKAIAFLCNRHSGDHTKNRNVCELVPTDANEFMCLVLTNKSPNISVRVDPACPLNSVIGLPYMSWYVFSMNKDELFFSCRQCEGLN